jgi:hypothetical protein
LCPSESEQPIFQNPNTGENQFAGTNYVVCTGSAVDATYDTRFPSNGMFWWGSATRFRDMTDGASNTLVMSESLMGNKQDGDGPAPIDPRRQMARYGGGGMGAPGEGFTDEPGHNPDLAAAAAGASFRDGRGRSSWIWGREHLTSFNTYMRLRTLKSRTCTATASAGSLPAVRTSAGSTPPSATAPSGSSATASTWESGAHWEPAAGEK